MRSLPRETPSGHNRSEEGDHGNATGSAKDREIVAIAVTANRSAAGSTREPMVPTTSRQAATSASASTRTKATFELISATDRHFEARRGEVLSCY